MCSLVTACCKANDLDTLSVIVGSFRSHAPPNALKDFMKERPSDSLPAVLAAASNGNLAAVKVLCEFSDIDETSHSGKTALFAACEAGAATCVAYLALKGAAISMPSSSNRNALHAAVEKNSADCLRILCEKATVQDITL